MTITVSAPNGATVDFPDGTDHATINSVMQQHFGEPQQPKISGDIANFGAGANNAIADTIGAPVDVTNWALNKGKQAINAVAGTDFKPEEHPIGGSETVKQAMGLIGANPDNVEAKTTEEKLARAAGGGVASMVIPGLGAEAALARTWEDGDSLGHAAMEMLRGTGTASNAVIGAISGVGGELAEENAPDKYKPLAGLGGQLAGGVVGGLATAAGSAVEQGIKYAWQAATEPAEVRAARLLLAKATEADAFRQSLKQVAAGVVNAGAEGEANLPGSKPTTFQATGDAGIGALEKGAASTPEAAAAFAERRAQQNAARIATLRGIEDPDASAALVTDYVKNRLDDITAEHAANVAQTADALADALAKAGGENFDHASAYGDALRHPLNTLYRESKENTNALWRAIDPDKTIPVFTGPLKEDTNKLVSSIEPSAKQPFGEEADILDNIKGLGPTTTFGNLTALRGRLTDAIRDERQGGTPTVERRLNIILGHVDDLLAGTAGEVASNPDQKMSMLDRLQAEAKAFQESKRANVGRQQQTAGENAGLGGVVNEPGGQSAIPTAPGSEGAPGGSAGGSTGDTGLPAVGGIPDDVAARYAAARAATANEKGTFGRGPIGAVLKSGPTYGSFGMTSSNVPKNLFDRPEALSAFVHAAGNNPDALAQMKDYAAFSLRDAAVKDGELDPARYAKWVKDHGYALRQFPEIAENFGNVAKAQEAMDSAVSAQEAALRDFQNGAAKHFLDGKDPVAAVGAAISKPEQFADLVRPMRDDPAAFAGVRRATVDYMLKKVLNTDEAGTIGDVQSKGIRLQRFINDNKLALSTLFNADERASMEAVAADMQRGQKSTDAVRMPGTSGTAIDSALANDFGESRVGKILNRAFGKAGGGSIGSIVGTAIGGHFGQPLAGAVIGAAAGMRAAERAQAVKQALADLLLNPEKAAAAIDKITAPSSGVKFHPGLTAANTAAKDSVAATRSMINGTYEGTPGERGMINLSGRPNKDAILQSPAETSSESRQNVISTLSSSTDSIPGLKRLTEAARAGDHSAARTLQEIARDSLSHLLDEVPSAKIEYTPTSGLYKGEREPSLGVHLSFDEADRPNVMAALAKFAKNFNQEQIHVRTAPDPGTGVGHQYSDGSFNTHAVRYGLKRPMTPSEAAKALEDSGLVGANTADGHIEVYYSGAPNDVRAIEQFQAAAEKLGKSLAGNVTTVEDGPSRFWAYGNGDGATHGYETISGDFRPSTSDKANASSHRVAARISGRDFDPAQQADEITEPQSDLQKRIAQAYGDMRENALDDPKVRRAYSELAKEVGEQFDAMPIKVEVYTGPGEPYGGKNMSEAMRRDVNDNNHLFIYGTDPESFGPPGKTYEGHPLLEDSGRVDMNGRPLLYNDLLRAVHDYYAHTMSISTFGPKGEEAAWLNHMMMTKSPWARLALTSETRGQNSWVNFRDDVNGLPLSQRGFADQKVDLLPAEFSKTGNEDIDSSLFETAVEPLTVNNILDPSYPSAKVRSQKVSNIAKMLDREKRDVLKNTFGIKSGQILGPNPETDKIIAGAIASEVKSALKRSGRNALDWYTTKVRQAISVAAIDHPEIETNPNSRMAFTAGLAITSQGEVVPSNVRLALQAYEVFKKTGRFPTDVASKEQKSMNGNFVKLNKLIDNLGLDGTREFLSKEFVVRDLEKAGFEIGGENKDTRVYGSSILGSKIGQGFYQNLNNNFNPVTMDLWFMRAWGRLTGTLYGATPETLIKQKARFTNALQEAGLPVPKRADTMRKVADQIVDEHEANYKKFKDEYKSGSRAKSELTLSAERYINGFDGINESPSSGGNREWMRNVVNQARDILKKDGYDITPADLQATWWYPEKELYHKLGGRDAANVNIDYATAFADAARKKGVSDAAIEERLRAVDR